MQIEELIIIVEGKRFVWKAGQRPEDLRLGVEYLAKRLAELEADSSYPKAALPISDLPSSSHIDDGLAPPTGETAP